MAARQRQSPLTSVFTYGQHHRDTALIRSAGRKVRYAAPCSMPPQELTDWFVFFEEAQAISHLIERVAEEAGKRPWRARLRQ